MSFNKPTGKAGDTYLILLQEAIAKEQAKKAPNIDYILGIREAVELYKLYLETK